MTPDEMDAVWERSQEPVHERARRIGMEDYAYEANHDRIHLMQAIKRVEELTQKWRSAKDMSTGSGSIVARAFAIEIEAALRGEA